MPLLSLITGSTPSLFICKLIPRPRVEEYEDALLAAGEDALGAGEDALVAGEFTLLVHALPDTDEDALAADEDALLFCNDISVL